MANFGFFTFVLFAISLNFAVCKKNTTEVSIDCTYSDIYHLEYEFIFTCSLKSDPDITQPNVTITDANECKKGKAEDDVEIFYASAKVIRYIPRGLQEVFVNLFGLRFDNTQLKYVTKDDFKQFPKLKMFISYLNHIEFLEKDLFINNKELEFVNFRLNRIRYIDPNVFDHVKKNLEHLWLDGTAIACGFRGAASNSAAKKQIELLQRENNACGNLDNAPPFYIIWLKMQEEKSEECEGGSESECDTKLAEKETECDERIDEATNECVKMLQCCQDPPPTDVICPAINRLPSAFLKKVYP